MEDSLEYAEELLAYRKSDIGRILADKQRFMDRIRFVGEKISHVFKTEHRYKVWNKLYSKNNVCETFTAKSQNILF